MKLIHPLIFTLLLTLTSGAQSPSATPVTNSPVPSGTASNAPAAVTPPPGGETIAAPQTDASPPAKNIAPKEAKGRTVNPSAEPGVESNTRSSKGRVPIVPPETGRVKHDAVNVRGQASFIGEVITKLKKGESVTLLEEISLSKPKKNEPARWFRIAMPSNTPVWINASFIDPSTKTVVPKKLKVRAGPGENFSAVGIMLKGAPVKEIRTVNDWTEIETPPETSAFVAADFIERLAQATQPIPGPASLPEVVAVPPAQTNAAPEAPLNPTTPSDPDVVPPATSATQAIAQATAPVVLPPVVEEPLPKRIVTREGIVRRSINLQTPSYFGLENPENRKIINYLYKSEPGFTLKAWIGQAVVVTGEEFLDARWPNTPVIEIQNIEKR